MFNKEQIENSVKTFSEKSGVPMGKMNVWGSGALVMLGLKERHQITHAIQLLGIKKRIANKRSCPCGCGKRLGACPFHHKLNEFRKMAPVSWFKAHALNDWNRI